MADDTRRKAVRDIVELAACDFAEDDLGMQPSERCYEECEKGNWCRRRIPELTDAVMEVFASDRVDEGTLIECSKCFGTGEVPCCNCHLRDEGVTGECNGVACSCWLCGGTGWELIGGKPYMTLKEIEEIRTRLLGRPS